jgi:hypothetical protein
MIVVCCVCVHARANLIKNGTFEAPNEYAPPAGELCPDWQITVYGGDSSPDLYCNDGSFGLLPETNGNFTGRVASDGKGWVAGNGANPEIFCQNLESPVLANTDYVLQAHVIRGQATGRDAPGGYTVYVSTSSVFDFATAIPVVTIDATNNPSSWELRSKTFLSPGDEDEYGWIYFVPYTQKGPYGDSCAYPGLDDVSLECSTVPEPGLCFMLWAMAVCGLIGSRRRKSRRS